MAFSTESRLYTYTVYHGIAWCGMALLAVTLLTICSLLAGLTLALGGLDQTLLQLKIVTGTPRQRQQALVVKKIKSHSTWMLCSLIISSVACGESLPFVIQSLWHGNHQWASVLLSTFSVALFAEILPQYAIPRQGIAWGYYCSPIIWGCMWFTSPISYPLARLLDKVAGRSDGNGMFTREEIAAVIKYHDLSDNSNGTIGPDAARIMLGALNLDSRKVGGDIAMVPAKNTDDEKDVEKADLIILQGLIVHWSDVKTVNIDDVVDEDFVAKVNSWSYSRIPVIGNPESHSAQSDPVAMDYRWEGKQIFGFLHIKNLLGADIRNENKSMATKVTVRDLPLYPLPIVPVDMPVYNILSVFQLGMSRMAVVVPRPLETSQVTREIQLKDGSTSGGLRWTASERTRMDISPSDTVNTSEDHSTHSNVDYTIRQGQSTSSEISPKPIGIVTFEDIIDAILQKTSRDESDFFNRGNMPPPTKCKKAADCIKFACNYVQNCYGAPLVPRRATSFRPSIPATMRRRNVSTRLLRPDKAYAIDGVDEISIDSSVAKISQSPKVRSVGETSCTRSSVDAGDVSNHELTRSSSQSKTESLPSRRTIASVLPNGSMRLWRHVSAAPRLPQLQRVTPFSRQNYSSYEKMNGDSTKRNDVVTPMASNSSIPDSLSEHEQQTIATELDTKAIADLKSTTIAEDPVGGTRDDSQEAFSLVSWCPAGFVDVDAWNAELRERTTSITDPIEVSRTSAAFSETLGAEDNTNTPPYQGFPPELLANTRKENRFPNRPSSSLPRMNGQVVDLDIFTRKDDNQSQPREESFRDDRALLSSHRRPINNSADLTIGGPRSSSFWV